MLETTARGLNPWAERGCDSQRSLFRALLVLGYSPLWGAGCGTGQAFPQSSCPSSTANPHMKLHRGWKQPWSSL